MTRIYLIDDQFNRHLEHSLLVTDLTGKGFAGEVCWNENLAKNKADSCVTPESIWNLTTTAVLDSVFLVDLTLGVDEVAAKISFAAIFDGAEVSLKNEIKTLLPYCDKNSSYYSAIFACAVLRARRIPTIIISSRAIQVGRELWRDWGIPLCVGTGDFEWPTWKDGILKLMRHPDPLLRSMLVKYQEPIKNNTNAWDHDWCDDAAIPTAQNVLSIESFDEERTTKEIKALLMRSNSGWEFRSPEHGISSNTLKAVLKVLDIDASVESSVFEFPVSPGIAFLISLKELLIASKDKGTPQSIRFFALPSDATSKNSVRVFGLRIEFASSEDNPDGLSAVLRLLEKLRTAGNDVAGPAGGLAEGIWNLGHCRSKGIRTFDEPWAEMFAKGASQWLSWPSFDKNSVTFHWAEQ